jgi:hypothetical protein
MNITAEQFKHYLEVFHQTLQETASNFLPVEAQKDIWYLAFLPARITGFVSTQFGVAFDYAPEYEQDVKVNCGSARIEDLIVKCPRALRATKPVLTVEGSNYYFMGIVLEGSFPFRLTTDEARIAFHQCLFKAATWHQSVYYTEVFGNRKFDNWTPEMAVGRAKDIVLAAALDVKMAARHEVSIDEYVASKRERSVLLLGDYSTEGMNRIETIRRVLVTLGYVPILIQDVPDHPHMDMMQKVAVVGGLCRFIIVDDSSKSGHLVEVPICKANSWVTILLRAGGKGASWMTAGLSNTSNVIFETEYDPDSPALAIEQATKWAENKLLELKIKYDKTYPWRFKKQGKVSTS